jgi:cysteinyl-tRNA synthetase
MSDPRPVQVTNTLSGKKEPFKTLKPGEARLYMCGPTVYNFTHIGNARTALTGDLMTRVLEWAGYKVTYTRNVTDIEDKIIKAAHDQGVDWKTGIAERFENAYEEEMARMKMRAADHTPRATESIEAIVEIIQGLIQKEFAYVAETPFGQDVYYRVKNFVGYGKLSKKKTDDLIAGARIEVGEAKESPVDFALWKASKPGEPSWDSPWGKGRPGWHIECSAMIYRIYGKEGIDLHLGGSDLTFPHHENEIAQSEAFCGHTLSPYWAHGGMLTIAREKMSKSLGNVFLTKDYLEQYGHENLRLMTLQHHYKGPIDFTPEHILRTEALIERLYVCKQKWLEAKKNPGEATAKPIPIELQQLRKLMDEALFDDFNAAKAIGHALKAARACFRENEPSFWLAWGEGAVEIFVKVFGLLTREPLSAIAADAKRKLERLGVSEDRAASIQARIEERDLVRKNKDFAASDRIRAELLAQGVLVMDGPDGSTWTLAESP